MHYHIVRSDLSADKTNQVLAALNHPDILAALERMPIGTITIGRLGDKQHLAWYDEDTRSVAINSARKRGVHFGDVLRPGLTWNMSQATSDKTESIRRSLLQELAHHIEASFPGLTELAHAAFADPAKRPITRYAFEKPGEYLAESLVAYLVERSTFDAYDRVGYKMVEQAIVVMRSQK